MADDLIRITSEPICLEEAVGAVGFLVCGCEDPEEREAGALVTFSGIVRATEGERQITHLDYEHYAGMAEKETARLVEEARRKWRLIRVAVLHRTGPVGVGESSVVVAVLAGHREESFAAARFLIDELKKKVPIWKSAPED